VDENEVIGDALRAVESIGLPGGRTNCDAAVLAQARQLAIFCAE
jgi:hypothetical protein